MAFLVIGSPMIVQLHCKGPTGKVSRISAGLAASMGVPGKNGWHILAQLDDIADATHCHCLIAEADYNKQGNV
jgi:hypothetical protein